jgi:hypothetical protein
MGAASEIRPPPLPTGRDRRRSQRRNVDADEKHVDPPILIAQVEGRRGCEANAERDRVVVTLGGDANDIRPGGGRHVACSVVQAPFGASTGAASGGGKQHKRRKADKTTTYSAASHANTLHRSIDVR